MLRRGAFQRNIEIWFGWVAKYDSVYHLGKTQAAVLALGTLVLLMLGLIPVLKYLLLGTAACLALGATIRTRFGTRPREFPEAF